MLAAHRGHLDVVQLLLAAKVDPSQRDRHGSPAWIHAHGLREIKIMEVLGKGYDPFDYFEFDHPHRCILN